MEKRIDLSCIIVTFKPGNIREYVEKNLALLKQYGVSAVVADNGGNDPLNGCTFLKMDLNVGYGSAVNSAMKHTDTKYVLVMNDDVSLTEKFIRGIIDSLSDYEKRGYSAVGFRVISKKTKRVGISMFNYSPAVVMYHFSLLPYLAAMFSPGRHDRSIFETIHYSKSSKRVRNLSGAIFLVSRKDFEKAGGFDSSIFLTYEETDLFRRLIGSGGSLFYDSEKRVRHEHSFTASKESAGESFVSMRYFMRKHYSKPVSIILDVWVYMFLLFMRAASFNRRKNEYDAFIRSI